MAYSLLAEIGDDLVPNVQVKLHDEHTFIGMGLYILPGLWFVKLALVRSTPMNRGVLDRVSGVCPVVLRGLIGHHPHARFLIGFSTFHVFRGFPRLISPGVFD